MPPALYVTSELVSDHTEQFVDEQELAESAPRAKASSPDSYSSLSLCSSIAIIVTSGHSRVRFQMISEPFISSPAYRYP